MEILNDSNELQPLNKEFKLVISEEIFKWVKSIDFILATLGSLSALK